MEFNLNEESTLEFHLPQRSSKQAADPVHFQSLLDLLRPRPITPTGEEKDYSIADEDAAVLLADSTQIVDAIFDHPKPQDSSAAIDAQLQGTAHSSYVPVSLHHEHLLLVDDNGENAADADGNVIQLLEVKPVTRMSRPIQFNPGTLVGVNERLFCYSKENHIRVIQLEDGLYTLLRGHEQPLIDLSFGPSSLLGDGCDASILCAMDKSGTVCIWKLDELQEDKELPEFTLLLKVRSTGERGGRIAWHPRSDTEWPLAFSIGSFVYLLKRSALLDAPATLSATEVSQDCLHQAAASNFSVRILYTMDQDAVANVSALCFSLDDESIAVGTDDGCFSLYDSTTGAKRDTFQVSPQPVMSPVSSIFCWDKGFVVACERNTRITLWSRTLHASLAMSSELLFDGDDLVAETNQPSFAVLSWVQNLQQMIVWPSMSDVGYLMAITHEEDQPNILIAAKRITLPPNYRSKCLLSSSHMFAQEHGHDYHALFATSKDIFRVTLPVVDVSTFDLLQLSVQQNKVQTVQGGSGYCLVDIGVIESDENEKNETDSPGQTSGESAYDNLEAEIRHSIENDLKELVDYAETWKSVPFSSTSTKTKSEQIANLNQTIEAAVERKLSDWEQKKDRQFQQSMDQMAEKLKNLMEDFSDSATKNAELLKTDLTDAILRASNKSLTDVQTTIAATMQESLIPAYQDATKVMFRQMQNAFEKGLSEVFEGSLTRLDAHLFRIESFLERLDDRLQTFEKALQVKTTGSSETLLRDIRSVLEELKEMAKPSLTDKSISSQNEVSQFQAAIQQGEYESAFNTALLSGQIGLIRSITTVPINNVFSLAGKKVLSQSVLLALIHQFSLDLSYETEIKMLWLEESLMALDPLHPLINAHLDEVLNTFYENIKKVMNLSRNSSLTKKSMLLMHIANSLRVMQK